MKMKSIKQITRQLETKKRHLAKLRDELRDLELEVEQYVDNASEAFRDLEACVETLSQYV
jgi:predicted  nucleic acid-binding Zn-ribbon protein